MKAPRNMSGVVGNKPGLKGFAGPFLEPHHYGDQRHAKGQSAIGEGHFNDILLHFQGFGV